MTIHSAGCLLNQVTAYRDYSWSLKNFSDVHNIREGSDTYIIALNREFSVPSRAIMAVNKPERDSFEQHIATEAKSTQNWDNMDIAVEIIEDPIEAHTTTAPYL